MAVNAPLYVDTLYDYTYNNNDGHTVSIHHGDRFVLLEKSNVDWWHVQNPSTLEQLYVPASYVSEVKPKISVSADNVTRISLGPSSPPARNHGKKYRAPSPPVLSQSTTSPRPDYDDDKQLKNVGEPDQPAPDYGNEQTDGAAQSHNDKETSEHIREQLEELDVETSQPTSAIDSRKSSQYEPPEYKNVEEMKSYMGIHPPDNLERTRLDSSENWEKHTDQNTGQMYYYNVVTRQTSWSLPEPDEAELPERPQRPVESPPAHGRPKLMRGYSQERDQSGDVFYHNTATNENWYCSADDQGTVYYYNSSGDTRWELPEAEELVKRESKLASSPPAQIRHLRDILNKTKVLENGKKVKKNWSDAFCIFNGTQLIFYKDKKSAVGNPKSPLGKAESVIDLQTARVEWGGKEKSSKKHVIQVTSLGAQYLLQSDEAIKIHEWYLCLSGAVAHFNSMSPRAETPDEGFPTTGEGYEDSQANINHRVSRGRHSKSTKKETYTIYEDANLDTLEKKSRIRARLRDLIRKRPTMEALEKQGILLEERVFGAHLLHLCDRERTTVPRFVQKCIAAIETRGLDIDGLYRVSGNLAQVQRLRFLVDQTDQYDLERTEFGSDVHVLTGALKLFFRELREPLFPFTYFERFLVAIKLPDRSAKLQAFQGLVSVLPKPNHDTLRELCRHLIQVCSHKDQNRMGISNLAIVFGPTLMWPEKETNMAVSMMYQNSIVEFFLLEYSNIFP